MINYGAHIHTNICFLKIDKIAINLMSYIDIK